MRKKSQKKSQEPKGRKGGRSLMMVGAAGAVIGAAVGAAGAMAMTNPSLRRQLGKSMGDFKGYALDTFDKVQEESDAAYSTAKKKIGNGRKTIAKKISKAKH
jgi:predicted lipoprotein with Yx(FWY)xxD motif